MASEPGRALDAGFAFRPCRYIGAIVEVPSYLTMPIMADKIGRTRAWGALLAGTATSLLLLAWLERSDLANNSSSDGGGGDGDSGGGDGGGGGGCGLSTANTRTRTHTSLFTPPLDPPVQLAVHPTAAETLEQPTTRPESGELQSFCSLK